MFIYQRVLSIHIHPVGDPMDPWRYHSYHSYPRDPHLSWVSCQGLQRLVIHGLFCITHRETYQYITNKVYVVSNICQIYVSKMLRISMYTIYIYLSLSAFIYVWVVLATSTDILWLVGTPHPPTVLCHAHSLFRCNQSLVALATHLGPAPPQIQMGILWGWSWRFIWMIVEL
jgi:hypothetical protein